MAVNIEQMRFDIAERQKAAEDRATERHVAAETRAAEREKELAWETRKFVLQALVAAAACVGAGVALANWVNSRPTLPAAPLALVAPAPPR